MNRIVRFYSDEACKVLEEPISFGPVKAGKSATRTLFVKNTHPVAELHELAFKLGNKETKILESPKELKPMEVSKVVVVWTPSITLEEGLDAVIFVDGEKWFKPKRGQMPPPSPKSVGVNR